MTELSFRIYEKVALCRAFEEECRRRVEIGQVKCPVYLSTGQEYVASTLAVWCEDRGVVPHLFVQHRAHSQYLAFGGSPDALVRQILFGMEGSNCIQSKEIQLYGHESLLGSQVPIATGFAYARREPTICFMGDATCEEDYALAALGWAATHRLPILFVVEDNNLSILTEKKVRRSWSIVEVARGFDLLGVQTTDDPVKGIGLAIPDIEYWPALLNVVTTRLRWHSGAGTDGPAFDRHAKIMATLDIADPINAKAQSIVEAAWSFYEP